MAYRKVDDASLSSVADAIRLKGGTSETLVFPDGFVSAISAIQAGGGDEFARSIVNKTITSYYDDEITSIGAYAFNCCSKLQGVNAQNVAKVGDYAFENCSALTGVNVGNTISVGSGAFRNCTSLKRLDLPKATILNGYLAYNCSSLTELNIPSATSGRGYAIAGTKIEHIYLPKFTNPGSSVFRDAKYLRTVDMPSLARVEQSLFMGCSALETVTFPKANTVASRAMDGCSALAYADLPICARLEAKGFYNCTSLETIILRKSDAICTLTNVNAFTGTKIASGDGYIYVPSALVDRYKVATNWSAYASQIRAIEDYPDVCGG